MIYSMLGGFFESFVAVVKEIFNFIPKVMYLLYASLASVLDVLQLFFRKIAGLDVYYVNGEKQTGDLLSNFIGGILGFSSDGFSYSALSTVFWAFVVFGIIMVFISTFVAVIKSHYSYDDKAAKGPMQYVYTAGKAIINIVAVPVIVFVGLFVSQALLTAVDSITSSTSGSVESLYGETTVMVDDGTGKNIEKTVSSASQYLKSSETSTGGKTYVFYDIFGVNSGVVYNLDSGEPLNQASDEALSQIASANTTFSGSLFKLAAYNGNRARIGEYGVGGSFTGGTGTEDKSELFLFQNADSSTDLADMIDIAFASNLHLKSPVKLIYDAYDDNSDFQAVEDIRTITAFKTLSFNSFSKFNVGLVWYYYDLWQFNFIVGFAACIVCASLFINIIMGLITRLLMCIGLFLVAPPLFGLSPIDGGKAGKSWRENFVKQVLMAYGAVVGMNLFFLILPYINNIDFFGPTVEIANLFAQMLIIITGLVMVKAFIAMVSGLIGGADANETGSKSVKEVGEVTGKAIKMTKGAAKLGVTAPFNAVRGAIGVGKMAVGAGAAAVQGLETAGRSVGTAVAGISRNIKKDNLSNKQYDFKRYEKQDKFIESVNSKKLGEWNEDDFKFYAESAGFDQGATNEMWKSIKRQKKYAERHGIDESRTYANLSGLRNAAADYQEGYRKHQKKYGSGVDFDKEKFLNEQDVRKEQLKQAEKRYERAKIGMKGAATRTGKAAKTSFEGGKTLLGTVKAYTPLDNTDTVLSGNDLYKGVKSSIVKKPDDAEKTAHNTKEIGKALGIDEKKLK